MSILPFMVAGIGQGAVYALSGLGIVVLYRTSGVVNLAFGAWAALGAICAWSLMQAGMSAWLAWLASVSIATMGSVAYGVTVASRLSHRDPSIRTIGTLGLALALLGVISMVWNETPRRMVLPTDQMYLALVGVRLTYTRLIAFVSVFIAVAAVTLLLNRTQIGLWMRALANSRETSALLGVPVVLAEASAWALSGALAGFAGVLLASMVRLQPSFLTFLVIPAVATAVLGRLHSLWRTVLFGLLLGICESLLASYAPIAPFRSALPYVTALVAFALANPADYMGRAS